MASDVSSGDAPSGGGGHAGASARGDASTARRDIGIRAVAMIPAQGDGGSVAGYPNGELPMRSLCPL